MPAGNPAKHECFLPDLIDLTTNLLVIGALFLIPGYWEGSWLGTEASLLAHPQKKKTFHSLHPRVFSSKSNFTSKAKCTVHSVPVNIQIWDKDHLAVLCEPVPTPPVYAAVTFSPILLEKMTINLYVSSHNSLCRTLALNSNFGVKLFAYAFKQTL